MTAEEPVRADILVGDGKIQRIESAITPQADWQVIDAAGLRVYPVLLMRIVIWGCPKRPLGLRAMM